MKKIIVIIVLVIMLTVSAYAEKMSFIDFCEATYIGEATEQFDGTYKMVMRTINGYQIVVTAPSYDAEEGEVTVVCMDGTKVDFGTFTMDDCEDNMMVVMGLIYNEYLEGGV